MRSLKVQIECRKGPVAFPTLAGEGILQILVEDLLVHFRHIVDGLFAFLLHVTLIK